MGCEWLAFPDADALAEALADRVAAARGTVALSGGKTPARLLAAVNARPIDWAAVTFLPVDERWVEEASDRSNAGLIRAALPRARVISLYTGAAEPDPGAVEARIAAAPWPPRLVVLGMGEDGHTASWFPGGDRLREALTTARRVESMRAPGAGEPRVTLTLSAVLQAEAIVLHVEGARKRQIFEQALGDGPEEALPIRAILRRVPRLPVYWCP